MKYFELFLRYPDFKTRAVTLSFDDGGIDDRKMIEIINRYGIKCTFNLDSGIIDGDEGKVQPDEFNELYKGHEIACHTYTHPHLDNLDLGGIAYQIIKDREKLEGMTGGIIGGFAYPFALNETEGMIDCIRNCGIKYARTTVATHNFNFPTDYFRWNPTCHQADPKFPELVREFFKPDDVEHPWRIRPLLFYLWGHSYEFKDNWQRLEQICEALRKNENVWYATNIDIIDYISSFKELRRSVNGKIVYNPTNTDIYVVVNGKNIILKKGETTVLE